MGGRPGMRKRNRIRIRGVWWLAAPESIRIEAVAWIAA